MNSGPRNLQNAAQPTDGLTVGPELRLGEHRLTWRFGLWMVAVTVLAAGLRLYNLDRASFWVDELNTIHGCADLGTMHRSKVLGYVPTALGLWASGARTSELSKDHPEAWRSLGVTERSARIGSAVFGIVAIPLLGVASCHLLGTRASAVLALLLAVAPWHIYWSQASRFYSQQFLFYNLCLIMYFLATKSASRSRICLAMILLVLAFLTQPPALVIVGVFALEWVLWLLMRRPVHLGGFGWASAAVALAVCAVILAGDVQAKPEQWTQFAGDLYQTPAKTILGTLYMVVVPVALFAMLSAWWLITVSRRLAMYLLLGAVLPPLVFAAISMWSYVGLRYAFVSLYCWLALAALGATQLYRTIAPRHGRLLAISPLALVICSMLLMNYGYYTSGAGFHTRWSDAFACVAEHRRPTDLVCTPHPTIGRYYLQNAAVRAMPRTPDELHDLGRRAWLVDEMQDVIRGSSPRMAWLEEETILKAVFDLRVVQPSSYVRVYLYDPDSGTGGDLSAGNRTPDSERQSTASP